MKEAFIEKNFKERTLKTIAQANQIIEAYQAQGYMLTVRQLYYQFVSRDLIPNNQREYNKLKKTISDARLAGLIDWSAIEDRTRYLRKNSHWDSPAAILDSAIKSFAIDKWEAQPYRPEVWIEKDALIGVIEDTCTTYDVPYFACRGYSSQSEQYKAALRVRRNQRDEQTTVILHLGDHDPSGLDMTRDNLDRLKMLSKYGSVEVIRLALNYDQVEAYNPPANPTKLTDSRATNYIEAHGHSSWELDALDPTTINALLVDYIERYRDPDKWTDKLVEEDEARSILVTFKETLENGE